MSLRKASICLIGGVALAVGTAGVGAAQLSPTGGDGGTGGAGATGGGGARSANSSSNTCSFNNNATGVLVNDRSKTSCRGQRSSSSIRNASNGGKGGNGGGGGGGGKGFNRF